MPQRQQQNVSDGEVYAQAIEQMARDIAESIRFSAQRKFQQKQIDLQSLTKVKDFMSLPPDKRKALLLDPHFRADMIRTLDPESFATTRKEKQAVADKVGMQQRETSALALGDETAAEKIEREKKTSESEKASAESKLEQQKLRLSTGVEAPTPMSLLIAGDVKDPIANALFSMVPKETLRDIALGEKKTGPMYQQQQQQEWYKWAVNEGLPQGVAMQTALSISKGEWDKVPASYTDLSSGKQIPVRGKAERELATNAINAASRAQEVQNTIQSSIAQSAAQLAEKSGLSLDQSRANVIALRSGKPAPFDTPALTEHVAADAILKRQEIEKNAQTILNDRAGIGVIKESLTSLVAEYRAASGSGPGGILPWDHAKSADLKDKIDKMTEELTSRLAGRYGIKFEKYEDLHYTFGNTVGAATSAVWKGMKATGAYGKDLSDAMDAAFPNQFTGEASRVPEGVGKPNQVMKHTPEQESVLTNLYSSFTKILNDPEVPNDQKDNLRKYIENVLEPAYKDPSKFNTIFTYKPQEED